MKTVIIFGAKGMLGSYTKLYFKEQPNVKVICFDKDNYDVRKITVPNIKRLFKNLKLQKQQKNFVINCSGVMQSVDSTRHNL